jgi:hypothetical protein
MDGRRVLSRFLLPIPMETDFILDWQQHDQSFPEAPGSEDMRTPFQKLQAGSSVWACFVPLSRATDRGLSLSAKEARNDGGEQAVHRSNIMETRHQTLLIGSVASDAKTLKEITSVLFLFVIRDPIQKFEKKEKERKKISLDWLRKNVKEDLCFGFCTGRDIQTLIHSGRN